MKSFEKGIAQIDIQIAMAKAQALKDYEALTFTFGPPNSLIVMKKNDVELTIHSQELDTRPEDDLIAAAKKKAFEVFETNEELADKWRNGGQDTVGNKEKDEEREFWKCYKR